MTRIDRTAHYARRIYDNALTELQVNHLEQDSLDAYARKQARRLHLDEDEIAAQVNALWQ